MVGIYFFRSPRFGRLQGEIMKSRSSARVQLRSVNHYYLMAAC